LDRRDLDEHIRCLWKIEKTPHQKPIKNCKKLQAIKNKNQELLKITLRIDFTCLQT
jgi:hypothetical protein